MSKGRAMQVEVPSTDWSQVGEVGVAIRFIWDVRGNLREDRCISDFWRVTQPLSYWIDEEQRCGGACKLLSVLERVNRRHANNFDPKKEI